MPDRGRGRGRGGGGRPGRGGRGGRVGKGKGSKGFKSAFKKKTQSSDEEKKEKTVNLDIAIGDVRGLFMHSTSFDQHYESQNKDVTYYEAALLVLIRHKMELSSGSKARALAAAIARHDHDLTRTMLKLPDVFGMVEVTKALSMLDSKRQLKLSEKRLAKLNAMKTELGYKVKDKKFSKIKNNIGNLQALQVKGSLSGAGAKHIKRWTATIPKSELEFYALYFPKEPWKQVADLCHLNAKKDFQLDWFLGYCFGGEAPKDSLVHKCSHITKKNLNEIIIHLDVPYSYLKKFKDWFNDETKKIIASKLDLTTLIWWYEDLSCTEVDNIIKAKLDRGEKVNFTYGKLMERIFTLKKKENPNLSYVVEKLMVQAETELQQISLTLKSPIAVLGDKSGSMQVCVNTSNIIASLLAVICDAYLNFFDTILVEPPFYPNDVKSVLKLSEIIEADHCTAPAASLYPFYEKKLHINTFIVVTDEEENFSYKGAKFAQLFKEYTEEVHNAELVFVSFLESQHAKGQMVTELQKKGIASLEDDSLRQFRFDAKRPDLTKLDHMFAVLSTSGDWFQVEVVETKERIERDGLLTAAFSGMTLESDDQKGGFDNQEEESPALV